MIVPSHDDDLRARAIEAVYEHWTTPRASEDLGPLPATEADRLARAAPGRHADASVPGRRAPGPGDPRPVAPPSAVVGGPWPAHTDHSGFRADEEPERLLPTAVPTGPSSSLSTT